MIYEICVIIATLALVVLVVYLICTLCAFKKTLIKLNGIMEKVDAQVEPMSRGAIGLLQNTALLTESVSEKLDAFDPLLQSISNVGYGLDEMTRSMGETPEYREEKDIRWKEGAKDLLELAALGLGLWKQIRNKR